MTNDTKTKSDALKTLIRSLQKLSYKKLLKCDNNYSDKSYIEMKLLRKYQDKFNRRMYVSSILSSENYIPGEYPIFLDKHALQKLVSSLLALKNALAKISSHGKADLRMSLDMFANPTKQAGELELFEYQVETLLEAAKTKLSHEESKRKTNGNINLRAISVVQCCEMIWEEIFQKPAPKRLGNEDQNENDFGKFVTAVFEILGIGAQPRTAQDMLRKLEAMIPEHKISRQKSIPDFEVS
jgi:hypothetical protein